MEWELLAGIPAADVRDLLRIARRRAFRRDEVVFHYGDPGDALHLISKGRFAIRIPTPLGRAVMLAVHGPGEAFGELALVSGDALRQATVNALEDGETFSVVRPDFLRVASRHALVKDALLSLIAEKLRLANEHLVAAHVLDAEARVRWALVQLERSYGEDGAPTVVPLTQEQIAELAGTARATVNRVLREEEGRGTLTIARGRLRLLDTSALGTRLRGLPRT